jgi:hypothetical protein
MSYPYLQQGDLLPAVGVLQKLLNRTGAGLTPDGDFGPATKAAVQSFQRPRRLGMDGKVGQITWPRIVAGERGLRVVDCVDIFDPSLMSLEATDIRQAGGNPVVLGGMSNGVEQAIAQILGAVPAGSVFLLRFHGHGASGVAGVSDGQGGINGEHFSSIHTGNIAALRPILARLRRIFSPYGCVQFMHCSTGRGAAGRQLLSAIARELGVPVSAAVVDQFGGGLTTFRYEGRAHTALPTGGSLRDWCARLPDFAMRSVA